MAESRIGAPNDAVVPARGGTKAPGVPPAPRRLERVRQAARGVWRRGQRPAAAANRWRSDLAVVVATVVGGYLLASALDVRESMTRWLAQYERWQADELPLTATVLAFGLAWYALRRRSETKTELRLREAAELRASELLARNRELAQQLIAVQENERRALARELHDELGQRCSAILVETACLRHCAVDSKPSVHAATLRTEAAAQGLYELVGSMLRRLRPANLDSLGLVAAMQELCEAWEERSGVACVFHHEGLAEPLPDHINITVYRITQESLTNVWRHAHATGVRVRLVCVGRAELHLSIQDDGCGAQLGSGTRGLGLLGAAERAASIGGTLAIESMPGHGLRLGLVVPLGAHRGGVAPAASEAR